MKAILHYLVLVGIPVLGILGLLQIGRRLQAPISVGGAWGLAVAPQSSAAPACAALPVWAEHPQMMISQSGKHLDIAFNDDSRMVLVGKLDGQAFIARLDPDLDVDPVLRLAATVDRQADPDRLEIEMQHNDCPAPLFLVATRQVQTAKAEGGN